ncbi:unnamed protein product [Closterium sp. NIES-54]
MCLRLHLRCYIRDGVSLLGHMSRSLPATTTPTEPAADADEDVQRRYRADSLAYRQWTERDAVAQRALAASCSCRLLSQQNLLWHHCLGHPSLPCLRGMHSHLLVFGLPKSLPPLPRSLALPCLPCVKGRQLAAPHSSFPPTTAPLQTLHMDLTVAQEEELASRESKELRRKSIVEARGTFACAAWGAVEEESTSNERGWGSNNGWGTSNTGGWGNTGGTWADADGGWAPHLAARQVVGVPQAEAGALPKRNKGGEKKKQSLLLFPSVVPRATLHLRYLPSDVQPHRDPWDTIDWGNEPSTPRHTVYGPDPEPREPTFVPGKIPKTNIPFSVILDREFLVLMVTTMNEEEGEEAPAEPAPAPEEDPKAVRARYMRTSGLRANDDLWHQRLGHPSCVTLKKNASRLACLHLAHSCAPMAPK